MFSQTFLYKQKKCQRHDWDLIQRHSGMAPRVCSELFKTTAVHSAMGTLVELTTAFLLKTGRSRFMPPSVKLDLCIPGLYAGPSSLDREAIDQALWSIALINGGDRKPKIYEWWLLISTIKRLHYNDYSIGDISSWRPTHGQLHGAAVYTSDTWAVHFRCKRKVIPLNWVVLITQGSTAEFPEM